MNSFTQCFVHNYDLMFWPRSLDDMSSFNPRGGEFIRRERDRGRGKANAKGKGGNRRPGKEARTKQRKSRAGGN